MPIFDQGYQHWSGELSGHSWRWLAITRNGVRAGMKSRLLRYVLYIAWLPALVLVLALCMWGMLERKSAAATMFIQVMSFLSPKLVTSPLAYRADVWRLAYSYFLRIELYFSMILILLVGPSLISQDLRFNALPLYFSRPLRRMDYFLGKLGVIVSFLGMVVIVPSIVAYIFGLLFSLDLTIIGDTIGILFESVIYGLVIAFSAGLLVLALSALSRNSRYVALVWMGLWFVSSIVAATLQGVDSEQRRDHYMNNAAVRRPFNLTPDMSQAQRAAALRAWRTAREKAQDEYKLGELAFSRHDWRPLISYTGDLSRMGQQLLQTNETWTRLSDLAPEEITRQYILANYLGPEFPWYWSAGVLAGVLALSACILMFSVKSLDRLK